MKMPTRNRDKTEATVGEWFTALPANPTPSFKMKVAAKSKFYFTAINVPKAAKKKLLA